MDKFKVIFYEKENGERPVEDFMDKLDIKMRAKLLGLLEILEEKGNMLREPYTKCVDDGIFELRAVCGNNISRIMFFFYYRGQIVLTNGFVKKTRKTPYKQIELAKARRADYIRRVNGK